MSIDEAPGISRRRLIKHGTIVGGAVVWVAPVVQSLASPAYAQFVSAAPEECLVDGKMTGGGFLNRPDGVKVNWDIRKMECPPQVSGPELKVDWTTGKGKAKTDYAFETDAFVSRVCTDNPLIPNGANADWDTVDGTATGILTINGLPQAATLVFRFVDGGEGGQTTDLVSFVLTGAVAGTVLNMIDAVNNGGNVQAHGKGVCI